MSIIVRSIVVIFCAYAGWLVAGVQFAELPADAYEQAQN